MPLHRHLWRSRRAFRAAARLPRRAAGLRSEGQPAAARPAALLLQSELGSEPRPRARKRRGLRDAQRERRTRTRRATLRRTYRTGRRTRSSPGTDCKREASQPESLCRRCRGPVTAGCDRPSRVRQKEAARAPLSARRRERASTAVVPVAPSALARALAHTCRRTELRRRSSLRSSSSAPCWTCFRVHRAGAV